MTNTPLSFVARTGPETEDDYLRSIDPKRVLGSEGERVGGAWFCVPGAGEYGWADELMPLATCLYKFVRNKLAHEAAMPENVEFFDDSPGVLSFQVLQDRFRISNSLLDGLSRAVSFAPENFDVFPDVRDTPDDVVAWQLFGAARDRRRRYLEQRAGRIGAMRTATS